MPKQEESACPICKLDDQSIGIADGGERYDVECLRCGHFLITRTAATMARNQNISSKLSAWIRERNELGIELPELSSITLRDIASNFPEYSVSEKQLLLLKSIARMSSFPGKTVSLSWNTDFPLAWASGEEEFGFYIRALDERHLIQQADSPTREAENLLFNVRVTSHGWDHLDQHARTPALSDQAFVATSFSEAMRLV